MFDATTPTSATTAVHQDRLRLPLRALVVAHIAAIILFSFQEGMTVFSKITAAFLVLSFVILVLGSGRKIFVPMVYRIWAVWFFIAFASTMLSDNPSLGRFITLVQLAAVGLIITNLLIWNGSTRFYTFALIGAAGVSVLWVMWDPGAFTNLGRLSGPVGNANSFGFLLSIAMLFSFVMGLATKSLISKVSWLALALFFFIFLLQTGSRKALVAGVMMGGAIVIGAYLYRGWLLKDGSFWRGLFGAMVAIPLVLSAVVASDFWFRMERAIHTVQGDADAADGSLIERMWMVERGFEAWLEHPILGIGIDNFRHLSQADHFFTGEVGTYAHSNYIEILVGVGLIGLVVYLAIYAVFLGKLIALRRLLPMPEFFARYTTLLVVILFVIVWDVQAVTYYGKLFWLLLPWIAAELHLLESERHLLAKSQSRRTAV